METVSAVGRRKEAVARIFIKDGNGKIMVNKKDYKDFFPLVELQLKVKEPLEIIDSTTNYDIKVNVRGGGIKGQAEAVRMGIGRVLCIVNPEFRSPLKAKGVLKRDARTVERKKPGLKKARKKTQYSKR